MSESRQKTLSELLAEDPTYPAWLKRKTLTPPAWFTCCHEAAHVVAALILLNAPSVMACVFDGREGASLLPRSAGLKRAIVISAGEAGSALARRHLPPSFHPMFFECDAACDFATSQPTDEVLLAECCGKACTPSRKAIRRRAKQFVRDHERQILKVATWLYANGSGEFTMKSLSGDIA